MIPAQTRANGLGNPSLPQLWLTAMLRMLVELVRNVASTFQMTRRRLAAECHSDVTPTDLPRVTSDTIKEYHLAAQHRSPLAFILRVAKRSSRRSERRSAKRTNWSGAPIRAANAEAIAKAGVLTAVSHTSPSRPLRVRSTSPCQPGGGKRASVLTAATKGNCLHQCEALAGSTRSVDDRRVFAARRRG